MGFNFGKAIVSQVKDRVYKKVVGGVGDIVRGIPGLGNSSILGQLIRNSATSIAEGRAIASTVSGIPWATKSSTVSTSPTERDTKAPTRRSVKNRWGNV